MIAVTGWTWEYIDNKMTLPRLFSMLVYLRKWPPVFKLVAAYLDYKEPEMRQTDTSADEFINAVSMVNGAQSGHR